MASRQLASKPAHHKQRVARSSPIFQISVVNGTGGCSTLPIILCKHAYCNCAQQMHNEVQACTSLGIWWHH